MIVTVMSRPKKVDNVETPKAKATVDEEVVYEKLVVLISMFDEEKLRRI